jgi:dipeptidyl aminopeptidase/acylaminoacyl peptidase
LTKKALQTALILISLLSSSYAQARDEQIKGKFVFNSVRALDDIKSIPYGDTGLFANENLNWTYLWEDGKVRRLRKNLLDPVLSPDGKRVAGYVLADRKIVIVDTQGQEIHSLSFDEQPAQIRWFPDGNRILYLIGSSLSDGGNVLMVYDFKTDSHTRIAGFGPHADLIESNVSPDEKKILLRVSNSKNKDITGIYILDGNKGWKASKIPNTRLASSGMWFPDSKHIAVYAYNDENGRISKQHMGAFYKVDVETGEKVKFRDLDTILWDGIKLSKDGKYFYLCKSHGKGGSVVVLWPLDDPTKEIPVTQSYRIADPDRHIAKGLYATDSNPDWWQGDDVATASNDLSGS